MYSGFCYNPGGYGGGLLGGNGADYCKHNDISSSNRSLPGGNQTYKDISIIYDGFNSPGGGWGIGSFNAGYGSSAGGGSGFVLNESSILPENYIPSKEYFLYEGQNKDKTTGFPSPDGNYEFGHLGNGAAQITILTRYIYVTNKCIDISSIGNIKYLGLFLTIS